MDTYFGMTADEAYEDYIKFIKENNLGKAWSKEKFLEFMNIAKEETVHSSK